MAPSTSESSFLLALPNELLRQILELVAMESKSDHPADSTSYSLIPSLRTCRRLYHLSLPMAYHAFELTMSIERLLSCYAAFAFGPSSIHRHVRRLRLRLIDSRDGDQQPKRRMTRQAATALQEDAGTQCSILFRCFPFFTRLDHLSIHFAPSPSHRDRYVQVFHEIAIHLPVSTTLRSLGLSFCHIRPESEQVEADVQEFLDTHGVALCNLEVWWDTDIQLLILSSPQMLTIHEAYPFADIIRYPPQVIPQLTSLTIKGGTCLRYIYLTDFLTSLSQCLESIHFEDFSLQGGIDEASDSSVFDWQQQHWGPDELPTFGSLKSIYFRGDFFSEGPGELSESSLINLFFDAPNLGRLTFIFEYSSYAALVEGEQDPSTIFSPLLLSVKNRLRKHAGTWTRIEQVVFGVSSETVYRKRPAVMASIRRIGEEVKKLVEGRGGRMVWMLDDEVEGAGGAR